MTLNCIALRAIKNAELSYDFVSSFLSVLTLKRSTILQVVVNLQSAIGNLQSVDNQMNAPTTKHSKNFQKAPGSERSQGPRAIKQAI